jgi:hypothetical protein
VIFVGIDDTDVKDSPGTNKLARWLVQNLRPRYESVMVVRHQLLFDPRIPYTSKNSSASLLFKSVAGDLEDLAGRVRRLMKEWFVPGSDPGLCVTHDVPAEVTAFGQRCQLEVVRQDDARQLAARHAISLEGLGGTEDGVIGALSAVGLVAGRNDGRVVSIGDWPDDLSGPQDIGLLRERGVTEIRRVGSEKAIQSGCVDIGKHLRPNYRGGRIVLFVEPAPPEATAAAWRAVRFP